MASPSKKGKSRSSQDHMSYRDLSESDIMLLTGTLSHAPPPFLHHSSPQVASYRRATKKELERLPARLENAKYFTFRGRFKYAYHYARGDSGVLCELHGPLNYYVARSLFHFVRREIDDQIPAFISDLREAGVLTKEQIAVFSVFDTVSGMWRSNFTNSFAAMRGDGGLAMSKWRRQEDHCYACMLARLGADEQLVFALAAGILGRHRGKGIYIANSKRLLWIESWLSGFKDRERMMDESWALGKQLKALATQVRRSKLAVRKVGDAQNEPKIRSFRQLAERDMQRSTATPSTDRTLVNDEDSASHRQHTESSNSCSGEELQRAPSTESTYSQSEDDDEGYDDQIIESYKHRTIYTPMASSTALPSAIPPTSGAAMDAYATWIENEAYSPSPPRTHQTSECVTERDDSTAPLLRSSTVRASSQATETPKPRRRGAQTQAFSYINAISTDPSCSASAQGPFTDPFADTVSQHDPRLSTASTGTLILDGPDENGRYTSKRSVRHDSEQVSERSESEARWKDFRKALRVDDEDENGKSGGGDRRESSGTTWSQFVTPRRPDGFF
ncbi:hypothetical protein W97_01458 [Coniosporium apollinis CBS 100218]|uniref:Uncharacterized protein n=1 Tax=Coniosporium apollinis (strain CBS 100218) TaxID=1168221 RepID=R7YJY3_CONA1|nr:uncharacterized protein W97_01458 [Coniosporium apollinis CBS 100218]EON62237.1 hypothetical protein W97_01458 [Coniosporium apollinis CBS 100218]